MASRMSSDSGMRAYWLSGSSLSCFPRSWRACISRLMADLLGTFSGSLSTLSIENRSESEKGKKPHHVSDSSERHAACKCGVDAQRLESYWYSRAGNGGGDQID